MYGPMPNTGEGGVEIEIEYCTDEEGKVPPDWKLSSSLDL
jgi:hypothetical protein